MGETEAEIDAHNRNGLWRDVECHLTVAAQSVEQAQSALEDLGEPDYADQLQEVRDNLTAASLDAGGRVEPS